MKALLMDIRVWPTKSKYNQAGDKVEIEVDQYTELTLLNLDSGMIELYNVESTVFAKWETAKEDFAKLKLDNIAKVLIFDTATKFGKTKITDCVETNEVVSLQAQK